MVENEERAISERSIFQTPIYENQAAITAKRIDWSVCRTDWAKKLVNVFPKALATDSGKDLFFTDMLDQKPKSVQENCFKPHNINIAKIICQILRRSPAAFNE